MGQNASSEAGTGLGKGKGASRDWLPWAVFGGILLLYLINRNPHVGFNDGLSFLLAAETGWDLDTNATSHFLYNNLLHLLHICLPFLPTVLLLTCFSVLCAMAALYQVYRTARHLTPERPRLALLPVVMLGAGFTFWQQSEIIEVYAFNCLIFASYLRLIVHDLLHDTHDNSLKVSFLLGIGLLTHIQHILTLPFFVLWVFRSRSLTLPQKLLRMLPWMGLMSILFIVALWTQAHSLRAIFVESQFQGALFDLDLKAMLRGVLAAVAMLGYNFHLGLLPMASGWRRMWRENRRLVWGLAVLLLPYFAFALKYAVSDNHVFYLAAYIVMVLPAGLALRHWAATRQALLPWVAVGLSILLYASATRLALQVPAIAAYDQNKAYKGGVAHLLWPGKASAPDPLALAAAELRDSTYQPTHIKEWNRSAAIHVLEARCAAWMETQAQGGGQPNFSDCPEIRSFE